MSWTLLVGNFHIKQFIQLYSLRTALGGSGGSGGSACELTHVLSAA
jgi:hypothetical protein